MSFSTILFCTLIQSLSFKIFTHLCKCYPAYETFFVCLCAYALRGRDNKEKDLPLFFVLRRRNLMKCNSIFQHRCATICAMCGWKGFICFPFCHQLLAARLFHNTHTHAYVNGTLESPADPIKQGSVKRKLLLDCFLITSSFASN